MKTADEILKGSRRYGRDLEDRMKRALSNRGLSFGILRNRFRREDPNTLAVKLEEMQARGEVVCHTNVNRQNGVETFVFSLAD